MNIGTGFLLGLRELRRTLGAKKDFSVQGFLDHDVSTGLIWWPADRTVKVEGSMESVGDGVLVRAKAHVVIDAQCSRCLTGFAHPVDADIQELFVYPEHAQEYSDEDVHLVGEDTIDLTAMVHDAIILDQPLILLCRPDCRGLCQVCGADRNADPDHEHDEAIDSRWLRLGEWGKMT